MKYDFAAYIWPSYTGHEDRTRIFWPDGIGEWQTVKLAGPRFEGHLWPRKPLLGYKDEAEPETMAEQIDLAASHGVNVFIYDWYWYDRRPFLENCLNDGYLPAARKDPRVKFYLMWANHDAGVAWDKRNSDRQFLPGGQPPVWRGDVDLKEFRVVCSRVIERYFADPLYYKIGGKPVFAIYDCPNLIKGLGGIDQTRAAFDEFREMCVKAGLPGLHLQLVLTHGVGAVLEGFTISPEMCAKLGFDSITHYQFVHFAYIDRPFPDALEDVKKEWERIPDAYGVPYFPHVSVGWDASPRFHDYIGGILRDNTPENVGKGFKAACEYADKHPEQPPLITVNAWNEWTEGSYLLPDDLYGYGYLDEIRKLQFN
ncbi:MAG: glycoside hydrolase family 99-like domain-containing protein [Clostridia bacterium]|nr:glycoside hydrolase family 99-like domain-containing protein [Clostridia bacterium]